MLPALALLATLLPLALAQYGDSGSSPTSTKSSSPVSSGDPGVHIVEVGNGGTKFTPDTLSVPVGERVEFRFSPQNHSVVQSSFDEPCVPLKDSALFSGFQPVQSGVGKLGWTVKINNTSPIWFYCSQGKHCQAGMSVVINPTPDKDIAAYKSASVNTTSSSPAIIQGGLLGPLSGSSPSSSSSGSESTPTGAGVRGVALGDAGRFILAMGVLVAASML